MILPVAVFSALTLMFGILCPQVRAAIADSQETAFITNPRQLILAGRRSGEGYFSQGGHQLVFQAERSSKNPFFQIFTLNFPPERSSKFQQIWGRPPVLFSSRIARPCYLPPPTTTLWHLRNKKKSLNKRSNARKEICEGLRPHMPRP